MHKVLCCKSTKRYKHSYGENEGKGAARDCYHKWNSSLHTLENYMFSRSINYFQPATCSRLFATKLLNLAPKSVDNVDSDNFFSGIDSIDLLGSSPGGIDSNTSMVSRGLNERDSDGPLIDECPRQIGAEYAYTDFVLSHCARSGSPKWWYMACEDPHGTPPSIRMGHGSCEPESMCLDRKETARPPKAGCRTVPASRLAIPLKEHEFVRVRSRVPSNVWDYQVVLLQGSSDVLYQAGIIVLSAATDNNTPIGTHVTCANCARIGIPTWPPEATHFLIWVYKQTGNGNNVTFISYGWKGS